jgi:hypothetical protein
MRSTSTKAVALLGGLLTAPFLFGASGNGCGADDPDTGGGDFDGGLRQDAGSNADANATDTDATNDGRQSADGGDGNSACTSQAGESCGGNTSMPCTCAPGLTCQKSAGAPHDLPGTCVPAGDGAVCVNNTACFQGFKWDTISCSCVPASDAAPDDADADAAPDDTDAAPDGADAAPDGADAAPDGAVCVNNAACFQGFKSDLTSCSCLPVADSCTTASDCHGLLVTLCVNCASEAGTVSGCAHWECVQNECVSTFCPLAP